MSRPRKAPASPEPRSGPAGETLAAACLEREGWRIVARNLRTVHGEIDLLARRRRTWAAVEVKARADHPAPERIVDQRRLDRLAAALQALAPALRPAPRELRLDVVAVRWLATAEAEVRHFPALRRWQPEGTVQRGLWRRPEAGCYAWPNASARPSTIARLVRGGCRWLAAWCRRHAGGVTRGGPTDPGNR